MLLVVLLRMLLLVLLRILLRILLKILLLVLLLILLRILLLVLLLLLLRILLNILLLVLLRILLKTLLYYYQEYYMGLGRLPNGLIGMATSLGSDHVCVGGLTLSIWPCQFDPDSWTQSVRVCQLWQAAEVVAVHPHLWSLWSLWSLRSLRSLRWGPTGDRWQPVLTFDFEEINHQRADTYEWVLVTVLCVKAR